MKYAILLLLGLSAGCSNYSFHSNLDKKNFTEYFKPSSVRLVEKSDLDDLNYLILGTVEGNSCQEDANQAPPSMGEARTSARERAADMSGNALLISKCIELGKTPGCVASVTCYGQAIKISDADK